MAEIVVIPAHVSLGEGSSPFPINIEGTTELTLANAVHYSIYGGSDSLGVSAASGAGAVGYGRRAQVAALKFGAVIGPPDHFEVGKQLLARAVVFRFGSYVSGPFANTNDRFLGLKFTLSGQVHYGWAGLSMIAANPESAMVTATLTAYAYETAPNTPIYAGQSSGLPAESRQVPANARALETASAQPAFPSEQSAIKALDKLEEEIVRKQRTEAAPKARQYELSR